DSDVDDVQALAMLHAYQQRGMVDLLGVVVTSDDSASFSCTDAINTFYGNPDLPIGFLKKQERLRHFSKYTRQVAAKFPHDLTRLEKTTESALLYRKLLANSPDKSVVIVTIGHLTSLMNFLQSPGDSISPLSGQELARKKGKKWLCMGGQYPEGKEANFYRPDPASTVYCLDHWTQEVVFCGWEVGNEIKTGGAYLKSKLPTNNPVYRAYQLYNDFAGRPAWDQVAVLLLDEDASARYFDFVHDGFVSVAADGSNVWKAGEKSSGKHHAFVKIKDGVDPDTIARQMDDLVISLGKKQN
ncbi:nucleoside hydrolase, partial [Persicitalea sp.]|uniref:nucleoside hydrolase n=1 Tax=Persicitalea sp. TaxID=3100273 RepID=UPI003592F811